MITSNKSLVKSQSGRKEGDIVEYIVRVIKTNFADVEEEIGELEFEDEDENLSYAQAVKRAFHGATDEDQLAAKQGAD